MDMKCWMHCMHEEEEEEEQTELCEDVFMCMYVCMYVCLCVYICVFAYLCFVLCFLIVPCMMMSCSIVHEGKQIVFPVSFVLFIVPFVHSVVVNIIVHRYSVDVFFVCLYRLKGNKTTLC